MNFIAYGLFMTVTMSSALDESVMAGQQTSFEKPEVASCNTTVNKGMAPLPYLSPSDPVKLPNSGNTYHTDSESVLINRHINPRINPRTDKHTRSLLHHAQLHDDNQATSHLKNGYFKTPFQPESKSNWTRFQLVLGERWNVGAELPVIQHSSSVNVLDFTVPIPRLTYDFGPVKLSMLYIPRIQDYTLIPVLGLYLIIKF